MSNDVAVDSPGVVTTTAYRRNGMDIDRISHILGAKYCCAQQCAMCTHALSREVALDVVKLRHQLGDEAQTNYKHRLTVQIHMM